MNKTEQWTFTHSGLTVIIKHWGLERDSGFDALNNGKGVWNYYVIIHEQQTKKFPELWLEDKIVRFFPTSPERVTHDYMNATFANVEWHGGITYYQKHGQVEGHRAVEMGCDFAHLWDMERGFNYTLEDVKQEAMVTAEQLAKLYLTN